MRQYVRTKTYLRKDSPWFWKQLMRALPRNPMATLPGGERDEDWSGVDALARAHNEEFRRELRRDHDPEIEIDLVKNQVRHHKQREQAVIEMEGARVWKPLNKVYVYYPTSVRGDFKHALMIGPFNHRYIWHVSAQSNVNDGEWYDNADNRGNMRWW